MIKNKWLLMFLGVSFLNGVYANDVNKATFYINKPYDQVRALVQANLQRCVTKKAGFFNSGRELVMDSIDTAIIFHIKEYQITGEIFGDLGSVVVNNENGKAVVAINQPNLSRKNLHLVESVRNWTHGKNKCIQP